MSGRVSKAIDYITLLLSYAVSERNLSARL